MNKSGNQSVMELDN